MTWIRCLRTPRNGGCPSRKICAPHKDQPFYHLLAENEQGHYEAYVSEQNLLPDAENGAVGHPDTVELFEGFDGDRYTLKSGGFATN
jgi:heat shock protein HspQ